MCAQMPVGKDRAHGLTKSCQSVPSSSYKPSTVKTTWYNTLHPLRQAVQVPSPRTPSTFFLVPQQTFTSWQRTLPRPSSLASTVAGICVLRLLTLTHPRHCPPCTLHSSADDISSLIHPYFRRQCVVIRTTAYTVLSILCTLYPALYHSTSLLRLRLLCDGGIAWQRHRWLS
jgi:hypothetical protein